MLKKIGIFQKNILQSEVTLTQGGAFIKGGCLLGSLEYSCLPIKRADSNKQAGWSFSEI